MGGSASGNNAMGGGMNGRRFNSGGGMGAMFNNPQFANFFNGNQPKPPQTGGNGPALNTPPNSVVGANPGNYQVNPNDWQNANPMGRGGMGQPPNINGREPGYAPGLPGGTPNGTPGGPGGGPGNMNGLPYFDYPGNKPGYGGWPPGFGNPMFGGGGFGGVMPGIGGTGSYTYGPPGMRGPSATTGQNFGNYQPLGPGGPYTPMGGGWR